MIEYDPHHWSSHFFDLKGSMVREIAYRIGAVALVAIVATAVHEYVTPLDIPDKAHTYIGPALALLLVFRTNAANDRYWEGRKLWGGIVNSSRNLRRKAAALLPDEPETVARIVEWNIAYCWAARARLVDRKELGPACQLPAEDQARALAAGHVPTYTAAQLTEVIADARRRGKLSDIQQQLLDADIQALIDYIGACERILTTPLPFAYAVHLRRSLILYCLTLPLALVNITHLWTPLVAIMISYVLIGIEEIGAEIEGPFGERHNDLPLDRICTTLAQQLRDPSNA